MDLKSLIMRFPATPSPPSPTPKKMSTCDNMSGIEIPMAIQAGQWAKLRVHLYCLGIRSSVPHREGQNQGQYKTKKESTQSNPPVLFTHYVPADVDPSSTYTTTNEFFWWQVCMGTLENKTISSNITSSTNCPGQWNGLFTTPGELSGSSLCKQNILKERNNFNISIIPFPQFPKISMPNTLQKRLV